jgi:hypothetical protein
MKLAWKHDVLKERLEYCHLSKSKDAEYISPKKRLDNASGEVK